VHDETLVQLHGGRVARQPNRRRGILYSPVSMETADGSQVRSGLSAGGRWIRTLGSPHHHATREAVRARVSSTPFRQFLFAAGTRFARGGPASHRSPIRGASPCGSLRRAVQQAQPNRSISSGCASPFRSRNLAPPDGRSRERCRGPP
jgi:hypothetical protein